MLGSFRFVALWSLDVVSISKARQREKRGNGKPEAGEDFVEGPRHEVGGCTTEVHTAASMTAWGKHDCVASHSVKLCRWQKGQVHICTFR